MNWITFIDWHRHVEHRFYHIHRSTRGAQSLSHFSSNTSIILTHVTHFKCWRWIANWITGLLSRNFFFQASCKELLLLYQLAMHFTLVVLKREWQINEYLKKYEREKVELNIYLPVLLWNLKRAVYRSLFTKNVNEHEFSSNN